MTGPRIPIPAEPADHPLRAALARGDRLRAQSGSTLQHLLATQDPSLVSEAVVAQTRGIFADLARQLTTAWRVDGDAASSMYDALCEAAPLRAHCHALALEWRLTLRLEDELALDPVLSPLMRDLVSDNDGRVGGIAMAAMAAQARFAQSQRRMQLPLGELPAELFHQALLIAEATMPGGGGANDELRAEYVEGDGRLALFGRLSGDAGEWAPRLLTLEEAGAGLWLSALAARTGNERDRVAIAAADPQLGRLLLSLRAAGLSPSEAERQALLVQPDAMLPRGLHDVGTREAAQWLAAADA